MLAILLASISLQNELSLTFHKKNGSLVVRAFFSIWDVDLVRTSM